MVMKNKTIGLTTFLTIILTTSNVLTAQEFNLSDYLNREEKDATLAVITMLQDASRHKNSKVIIEKGTYHFYPEKAFEQYCYVTNHDNGLKRIAFPIKGFDGFTLEANGSKFIFHGLMMPFNIEDSKNIDLSGFTIDWHIPLHSEGLIVANDSVNKTFDIKLAENMPYTIRNNQLIFIKEGYEHDLDRAILFDPKRKAVAYRTSDYTPLGMTNSIKIRNEDQFDFENYVNFRSPEYQTQRQEYAIKAEELEPGLVRILGNKNPVPPVGMVLACKGRNGYNRLANAIHINKSSDVILHDITIHHAGGMGILGERSEDITLENVNILTNPNSNLLLSTSADATHFSTCKGKVVINNCNFRHQLDDATNIHGAYVVVEDILGPDKLGVRVGHFQQAGFIFAEEGDQIGFINQKTSTQVEFITTVKSSSMLNDTYYIITLNESVTDKISSDYIVENLDWYPEIIITNNQFADNRARGILLKSPRKTIVKNNYFSNMMSAISIGSGINTFWYESGVAHDVLIEGNTFGDSGYGSRRSSDVIRVSGQPDRALSKIIINNNTFNNYNPSILSASWVKYLEFTNNTINNSKTFPPGNPDAYVVEVDHVETFRSENVEISEDFKNKFKTEEVVNKRIK